MGLEVGDVVRVNYAGSCMGQRILYGMDFVVEGTDSEGTVVEDLDHVAAHFADNLAGRHLDFYLKLLPENYTITEVRTQKLNAPRSAYVSLPKSDAGLYEGVALTANLQMAVTFRTAFAGRNQVSVKKIGPMPNPAMNAGAPVPTYIALLNDFADHWVLPTATVGPAIDLLPVVRRDATGTYTELETYYVSDRVGTMRRRTLRVGE